MSTIQKNIEAIYKTLSENIRLIAVSKTKPIADLQEAYDAGQRDFGENKIQEMTEKSEQLPKDIRWHMIGHVQTNKVKYMAPYVYMIHAVDSLKLLKEINKQASKYNRTIKCLLQLKIAKEEEKFGLNGEELIEILDSEIFKDMKHLEINGLMGMATFTADTSIIKNEFNKIANLMQDLQPKYPFLNELSTGMSGDYQIAITKGSTMVRIGSAIFGER
ncbi:YggS family pyridoxal phosphate-dependent enzyme [Aquimarina sp. ERC-38]|uniref:YggS family pyridoxal phosphate-dependent enzyme n=1 Tax=Aquimarina sp. ERC-38 TaxID=2949996 RepID=UPI0022467E99|nr:YggS family pyridoxal phosphate-dependent enzyme [Aquimarina sp. ERC-38]UZO79380.1 YggS family pyridoxal phosphate-dependent enzyme [Aquimarina sp. ERC-38]